MPSDIVDYANRQFNMYILDEDIEENILQNHPVPSNIQEMKVEDDVLQSTLM